MCVPLKTHTLDLTHPVISMCAVQGWKYCHVSRLVDNRGRRAWPIGRGNQDWPVSVRSTGRRGGRSRHSTEFFMDTDVDHLDAAELLGQLPCGPHRVHLRSGTRRHFFPA